MCFASNLFCHKEAQKAQQVLPILGLFVLLCGADQLRIYPLRILYAILLCAFSHAKVAELADAPDLGSGTERCGGSSPPFRTIEVNPKMKTELIDVSPTRKQIRIE